jgi:ABC-type nickel/cobalt efflux system permease component RcnA
LGVVVAIAVLLPASPASAHPLGNFTVNQYSGLRVQPDRVLVDLVVDMAEIPTFQDRDAYDSNGDGRTDSTEASAYRARSCSEQSEHVQVRVDGRPAPVRVTDSDLSFPPGQGGLATLRLTCNLVVLSGPLTSEHDVDFHNRNLSDRVGWHEVTAVGDGATLVETDVPRTSVSRALTIYPDDLLQSPLDQRTASLRVRPGGPRDTGSVARLVAPGAALPRGIDSATQSFTDLVARRDITVGFGIVAFAIALFLGSLHATAPGHGKTVMAAYLVGQRGSPRQAALVGLTVTATHTLGVLILGIVLSTSTVIAPERLYPWLGLASGLLLAGVGAGLLRRAMRSRRHARHHAHDHHAHDHHDRDHHAHDHAQTHTHGGQAHSHAPIDPERPLHWRSLVAMGFAGGLVPAPSALVVLLGAMALGRTWFGVVLVVAYGLGMAVTLTLAGLLLLRARRVLERRAARSGSTEERGAPRISVIGIARAVPLATSSLIVVVGLYLAARGVSQL